MYRAILMLSLLWPMVGATAARDYRIDPVHSRVMFQVEHLGFSRAIGTFSAPRGWLRFDPEDWSSATGEIELDLATLDLGDAEWNTRMARGDGFDTADHPLARWTVQRIEPTGERAFNAHGLLHFRGGDHPLTLAVTFNRLARHPLTLRRTAGFSARATLSRTALGLDKWKSMVGDAVELQVEVEARRGRRRADDVIDDEATDTKQPEEPEHAAAQPR
jgi:polyisoprenoid-binding protein YceI